LTAAATAAAAAVPDAAAAGSAEAGVALVELVATPVDPLIGVSPGQTAVLYVGTRVLGQFTIDTTVSAVPAPVARDLTAALAAPLVAAVSPATLAPVDLATATI
jgi:tRNA-specific 2-thiouridylase